jgi:hypothetical protein
MVRRGRAGRIDRHQVDVGTARKCHQLDRDQDAVAAACLACHRVDNRSATMNDMLRYLLPRPAAEAIRRRWFELCDAMNALGLPRVPVRVRKEYPGARRLAPRRDH